MRRRVEVSAMQQFDTNRREAMILAALAFAMAATRMDHFGGALALPDASLAVFFLAGLWLRASFGFPALLVVALGVDLAALAQSGLGADCLSPAYPFLMAAYGGLWAAGRRCQAVGAMPVVRHIVPLSLAATLAFAISNLSWFAFSGQFTDRSVVEFAAATLPQAPWYLGWAAGYTMLGLVARRVLGRSGAGWLAKPI
jgi:hypothetical protein